MGSYLVLALRQPNVSETRSRRTGRPLLKKQRKRRIRLIVEQRDNKLGLIIFFREGPTLTAFPFRFCKPPPQILRQSIRLVLQAEVLSKPTRSKRSSAADRSIPLDQHQGLFGFTRRDGCLCLGRLHALGGDRRKMRFVYRSLGKIIFSSQQDMQMDSNQYGFGYREFLTILPSFITNRTRSVAVMSV